MKKIVLGFLICGNLLLMGNQTIQSKLNGLAVQWNDATNQEDNLEKLRQLYASKITYYRNFKDANFVINEKRKFFKKYPWYEQTIKNVKVSKIATNLYNVSFDKYVQLDSAKETKIYPSYLVVKVIGNRARIVEEGDNITDYNIKYKRTNSLLEHYGDFNGDGKKESMYIVEPKLNEDMDCIGECTCYIRFSDKNIPSIKIENCMVVGARNIGDLNNNGTDEIGYIPALEMGTWHSYNVMGISHNKWIYVVDSFIVWEDHLDRGMVPILKAQNGYVYTNESVEYIIKKKLVKVRK